jgi:hypothetical protein
LPSLKKWKQTWIYFCESLVLIWYGESWYCDPTARTEKRMASHEAETGREDREESLVDFARSSRYIISRDSRSSISITKPQKGCGTSLYDLKSLAEQNNMISPKLIEIRRPLPNLRAVARIRHD